MLNLYKDIDFFTKCEIPTSAFNRNFASSNIDWNILKSIYQKNGDSPVDKPIPKLIHFIWIGGDLPNDYKYIIDEWKEKTKFDICIWTDENAIKFLKDKTLYNMFCKSNSFGIRTDVLRYEILKEFGGVYIDTDFICLNEDFATLHNNIQFYAGSLLDKEVQMGNGIIGTIPNHPIIDLCIEYCDDSRGNDVISCEVTKILFQTGPWVLTASILNYIKNNNANNILIFPSQSFHPFPGALREHNQSLEFINKFIKPWSMACHLWHCSWQPNSKFFKGYKITNE